MIGKLKVPLSGLQHGIMHQKRYLRLQGNNTEFSLIKRRSPASRKAVQLLALSSNQEASSNDSVRPMICCLLITRNRMARSHLTKLDLWQRLYPPRRHSYEPTSPLVTMIPEDYINTTESFEVAAQMLEESTVLNQT
jgi:hypothetical protein